MAVVALRVYSLWLQLFALRALRGSDFFVVASSRLLFVVANHPSRYPPLRSRLIFPSFYLEKYYYL